MNFNFIFSFKNILLNLLVNKQMVLYRSHTVPKMYRAKIFVYHYTPMKYVSALLPVGICSSGEGC